MRIWWKKRESMLCWMTVNWIIVVKVEIKVLSISIWMRAWWKKREYVMLNDFKLNNSCKSGNRSLRYIDLNESLGKEEKEIEIMLCWFNVNGMIVVKSRKSLVYGSFLWNMGVKVCRVCAFIVNVTHHDINNK
jgi:hypothetical protein